MGPAHFRWLETIRFNTHIQQIVFAEYIDTVKDAQRRVASLEKQMEEANKLVSGSCGEGADGDARRKTDHGNDSPRRTL